MTSLAERSGWPRHSAALLWLVVFCGCFFSLTLPNNPSVNRGVVLQNLPVLLIDTLLPGAPDRTQYVDPAAYQSALEHWQHSGWSKLAQRIPFLLTGGLILVGATALGSTLLRALRVPLEPLSAAWIVFAAGLGRSVVSLLTLATGLAGCLSRPLWIGLLVAFIAIEAVLVFRSWPRSRRADPFDARLVLGLMLAAPFVLCILLGAMLPEVDFDVKEYHFEGPKEWYQQGRITILPHNVYTSFPFCTEMFTLLGMVIYGDWYWGAIAGKVVLADFAAATALGLYAAGARWVSRPAGICAALIHLSTPWIYRISTIAYAEGGLTFYLFASLFALLFVWERRGLLPIGESRGDQHENPGHPALGAHRFVLLTALMAGSAMACKYPGLTSVVVPMFVGIVVAFARGPGGIDGRAIVRAVAVFAVGVAITVGPWLAKNACETGNPVYPLLYSVFGGKDWDAELNAKWKRAHSPDTYSPADIPVKLVDVTLKSDWLSPLLYAFAPLAWLVAARRRFTGLLWLYVAWLFATWWLLTHRIDRFWVPMIPVVSLLAGIGATWSATRLWRASAGTITVIAAAFNLLVMTVGLSGYNAYLLDLTLAQRDTTNAGLRLLNADLPADARVLSVGEAEVFDARRPMIYNTVFDYSIFQEWCAQPEPGVPDGELKLKDAIAIRQAFADAGVTHVYANWQEILRYRRTYGYTDFAAPSRFAELQRMGILSRPLPLPAYREWKSLGEDDQREIERWAPELKTSVGGVPVFVTLQLFEVLREPK